MKTSFLSAGASGLLVAALTILAASGCSHASQSPAAPPYAPATTAQAATPTTPRPVTPADIRFMTGMIGHHAQAVLIAGWAPSHGASRSLQALCERIVVGQNDEIAFMQRWLKDHNQPVPQGNPHHMMPGMPTDPSMMMPGMLTDEQLIQLDQAHGAEFDRLFLTFMIQHHQGALTMVQQLINSPGAAQDDLVFKFISDMNADQTIEIDRMTSMLASER